MSANRGWLVFVAGTLAGVASSCEAGSAPHAPPSDEYCTDASTRPDERPPFFVSWCSADWALPACYRLVADPGECPEGEALLGCYFVLDGIAGRWDLECGVPAECEPNYLDNPPCCPAELTEATTCSEQK